MGEGEKDIRTPPTSDSSQSPGRRGYRVRAPLRPNDNRSLSLLKRNETRDMPSASTGRQRPLTPSRSADHFDPGKKDPSDPPQPISRRRRPGRSHSDDHAVTPKASPIPPRTLSASHTPGRKGYKLEGSLRQGDTRSLAQLRRNETNDMPARRGRRNPTATARSNPTAVAL